MAAPFKFNAQVDRASRAWFAKKLQIAYKGSPGPQASWHDLIRFLNSQLGVRTPPEPPGEPRELVPLTPDLLERVRSGTLTAREVAWSTGKPVRTILDRLLPDDARAARAEAKRQARLVAKQAGLCTDCRAPVSPGRTRCPVHLESASLSGKRHQVLTRKSRRA